MAHVLKHLLFSIFTFTVGGYFFYKGASMPKTASLFPNIVTGLVFLLSGAMVAKSLKEAREGSGKPAETDVSKQKLIVSRVILFTISIAMYIYLIPRIGYFIATPLFMTVTYLYLRAVGIIKALFISLCFSLFIYLLFVWFLKLPIPLGILEPLFEV